MIKKCKGCGETFDSVNGRKLCDACRAIDHGVPKTESRRGRKIKFRNNVERDVHEAEMLGVSYGQYKGMMKVR